MIAVIAVIARHRRNRKGKTLPLMNADKRGLGKADRRHRRDRASSP